MANKDLQIAGGVFVLLFVCSLISLALFPETDILYTTTPVPPAGAQPVLSIFALMDESLQSELGLQPWQWMHAVIAGVFGVIALKDGEFIFKWLIIGAVFAMALLLALSEVTALLGQDYPFILRQIIALQVGVGCAYAAWCGISGVMLAIGAGLGVWLAHQVQALFVVVLGYKEFASSVWLVVLWYTVLILAGMLVMHKKKYMTILALLSSAFGGALVTASVFWFATVAVSHYHAIPGSGLCTPVKGPWVKFLILLFTSNTQDVGLFAEFSKVSIFHAQIPLDRVVACATWLILFVLGARHQISVAKLQAELNEVGSEISRSWSRSSWGSGLARELKDPLKQPMLEQSELEA